MKLVRKKKQPKFQEGDEVRLSGPFTFQDDDVEDDADYDKEIRDNYDNYGVVLVPDSDPGQYDNTVCYVLWGTKETVRKVIANELSDWDPMHYQHLYTDESCLELILPPVTDEEVEQAIQSIKQAAKE